VKLGFMDMYGLEAGAQAPSYPFHRPIDVGQRLCAWSNGQVGQVDVDG